MAKIDLRHPITAEQEVHTDLPCKLWAVSGTTDYDNSKGATVSNFKGIVAHDADVKVEDLIVGRAGQARDAAIHQELQSEGIANLAWRASGSHA